MKSMYEVFNPRDGRPVFSTTSRWLADVVAWFTGYDYAKIGDGWVSLRHMGEDDYEAANKA